MYYIVLRYSISYFSSTVLYSIVGTVVLGASAKLPTGTIVVVLYVRPAVRI